MASVCTITGCEGVAVGRGYCNKHHRRFIKHGDPLKTLIAERGTGTVNGCGYRYIKKNGREVAQHHEHFEKLFGGPIPKGYEVHHKDGDRLNNDPDNLVLCKSRAEHQLIHQQDRAEKACGNKNWRKCTTCKQYDAPENLVFNTNKKGSTQQYHAECAKKREQARRDKLKMEAQNAG